MDLVLSFDPWGLRENITDQMASSFQLGIRISMSHEEEPLGTGQ